MASLVTSWEVQDSRRRCGRACRVLSAIDKLQHSEELPMTHAPSEQVLHSGDLICEGCILAGKVSHAAANMAPPLPQSVAVAADTVTGQPQQAAEKIDHALQKPTNGDLEHLPTIDSLDHKCTGSPQDHLPSNGDQEPTPISCDLEHSSKNGDLQHLPTNGQKEKLLARNSKMVCLQTLMLPCTTGWVTRRPA